MNRIDRLIIKARESIGVELIHAMVECCGAAWTATIHLLDRRHGVQTSNHATVDAAIDHIHALAQIYPNSQDVTIIVDDISTG